ncbi:hypothetical protein J4Q44_G00288500 [Coregonus suidteri]|uniref:Osteoclast-stimulating factor 1 n=1 Tax=Coregonus suidteri TaxID=861788 RepID=A0AAN8KXL5_9TELE
MEAVGKYDFTATADDELSFRKGDNIKILGPDDDWLKAELHGKEGFIPRNYINIHLPSWYQESASRGEAQESLMAQPIGSFLIRGSESSPGDFSISVRHEADVQHFKVMRDSRGQYYLWAEKFSSLNELVDYYKNNSVSKHSRVYLLDTVTQERGFSQTRPSVPSSQPQFHQPQPRAPQPHQPLPRAPQPHQPLPRAPQPHQPLPRAPQPHQPLPRAPQPHQPLPRTPDPIPPPQRAAVTTGGGGLMQVRAQYDFNAEEKDELSLKAGDIIEVLECSDMSWWKGRLRGRTGLFPSNYTNPV